MPALPAPAAGFWGAGFFELFGVRKGFFASCLTCQLFGYIIYRELISAFRHRCRLRYCLLLSEKARSPMGVTGSLYISETCRLSEEATDAQQPFSCCPPELVSPDTSLTLMAAMHSPELLLDIIHIFCGIEPEKPWASEFHEVDGELDWPPQSNCILEGVTAHPGKPCPCARYT